jgi:phage gpG-like protein
VTPKPFEFLIQLKNNLSSIEQEIVRQVVAVEGEAQWASHFRRGGFEDHGFTPWQPRKKSDGKSKRALLVESGALRRAATKGRVQGNAVAFVVPLPYAEVHNHGGRAGRGAGFQMPKRQYIGDSDALNRRVIAKAVNFLNLEIKKLSQ